MIGEVIAEFVISRDVILRFFHIGALPRRRVENDLAALVHHGVVIKQLVNNIVPVGGKNEVVAGIAAFRHFSLIDAPQLVGIQKNPRHKPAGGNQVIRLQKIVHGTPHTVFAVRQVVAERLEGNAVPGIDIDLLRLLGKIKREIDIVDEVFRACQRVKISAAVFSDEFHVAAPAVFRFQQRPFLRVVDLPDMFVSVKFARSHQPAENRVRTAQHPRTVMRAVEDHVLFHGVLLIITGILRSQRNRRGIFNGFFDFTHKTHNNNISHNHSKSFRKRRNPS